MTPMSGSVRRLAVDALVVDVADDAAELSRLAADDAESTIAAALADVPTHAITVTIPALLRARRVLAIVPESRKAEPVRQALEGPVGTDCPATALRSCGHARLLLDAGSASLLAPGR